ncbi:MAG: hypothetical protein JXL85_03080, partial [Bacilli bacterium]|nr:hypothetical protein [Bacilli bacterium]
ICIKLSKFEIQFITEDFAKIEKSFSFGYTRVMNELLKSTMIHIAKRFHDENIIWGLGGSALLDIIGLNVMVNDLDIMVEVNDFDKAIEILSHIGEEKFKAFNPKFRTARFKTFRVNECDVDVMSGIGVCNESVWFDFDFTAMNITSKVIMDSTEIPLMALEDWHQIYQALQRKEKVDLIDRYMNEKGKVQRHPLER